MATIPKAYIYIYLYNYIYIYIYIYYKLGQNRGFNNPEGISYKSQSGFDPFARDVVYLKIGCTWLKSTKYVYTCIIVYICGYLPEVRGILILLSDASSGVRSAKTKTRPSSMKGNHWFLQSLNKQDTKTSRKKIVWQSISICWPFTLLLQKAKSTRNVLSSLNIRKLTNLIRTSQTTLQGSSSPQSSARGIPRITGTNAPLLCEWLKISIYLPPIDCRSFCRL